MKIMFLLLVFAFCFLGCKTTTVETKPVVTEILKVEEYEDGKLIGISFFESGLLKKDITYNTQNNTEEFVTKYHYDKNGKYQKMEYLKKPDYLEGGVLDEINDQDIKDFEYQVDFLKSKDITFNLPNLVADEVAALAHILSVADNYKDYKKEVIQKGNNKIIKFKEFNKNMGFRRSRMETFIHADENVPIKDYELILENNHPVKEIYTAKDRVLTKNYFYEDKKLVKVLWSIIGPWKVTLEKKFVYTYLDKLED